MRVARYIRWSTEEQTHGTTREVQLGLVNEYCARQGWPCDEHLLFVDEGQSGGSLERPALERLRREIAAGRVDLVVVARLDRLARSLLDAGLLVMREWEGRAELRSATESFDLMSPFGRQAFYNQVGFAELERAMIRERTLSGKLQRARRGENPGVKPPYGYRLGPRGQPWPVVEHEAAVVRRVFSLYMGGFGLVQIRDRLNREGVPAARGGCWTTSSLHALLQNPVYAGRLVYGRTRRAGRGRRVRGGVGGGGGGGATERIEVDAAFAPALVDPATFEAVQRLRREKAGAAGGGRRVDGGPPPEGRPEAVGGGSPPEGRPEAAGGGPPPAGRALAGASLLTGVARCRCGGGIVRRSGGGAPYYGCAVQHGQGRAACPAGLTPQAAVDRLVAARFLERYAGLLAGAGARPGVGGGASADEQAVLRRCRAEAAELERQRRRIGREYRAGAIDAAEFRALQADVAEEMARVAAREAATRARLAALEGAGPAAPDAAAPPDPWLTLTVAQRKLLLRAFLASLTLWRDPGSDHVAVEAVWRNPATTSDRR